MTDEPVAVYRPPWFVFVWTLGVLVWVAVLLVTWSAPWPVTAFFLLAGAGIAWRTLRVALVVYPDRLVVRNTWTTERVSRSVVDGFGIGRSTTSPVHRTLVVSTRHGRLVSADVLASPLPGPYGLGRARRAVDRLTEWLA